MTLSAEWLPGGNVVEWQHGGDLVRKEFAQSPQSVASVPEADVVVIVTHTDWQTRDVGNAIVYGADGEELMRLQPPVEAGPRHTWIGFDQVFVGVQGVTAVFATETGDYRGTPDFDTGELRDVTAWR